MKVVKGVSSMDKGISEQKKAESKMQSDAQKIKDVENVIKVSKLPDLSANNSVKVEAPKKIQNKLSDNKVSEGA